MKVLTDEVIASFKDAARKLTGPKRRAFQAQVTLDYLDGSNSRPAIFALKTRWF